MTDLIDRLIAWVSELLNPRGAHRYRTGNPRPVRTTPHHPAAAGVPPLPSHRSPYGLPSALDGTETAAVRPYLLAHPPYELEAAA
ncbi:hypothetical protein ACFW5I_13230 [Streptomyces sp. NPDC058818]|uniref:hypothetical protein n=1 Tax=Streptomyces sp. NPDC058818 TaxID=3346640 RepID=UPI0036AEBDB7